MKKVIIAAIINLIFGVVIGAIGAIMFFVPEMSRGMLMIQENEIIEQIDGARNAYYYQTPEIAEWALNHVIRSLNELIEERSIEENDKPACFLIDPKEELYFAHGRLAILYKNSGDMEQYSDHMTQAIESYPHKKEDLTAEKVIERINAIDQNFKKRIATAKDPNATVGVFDAELLELFQEEEK